MQHLSDLKQETYLFVGILVFMSSWNFVLSWVEHEKFCNLVAIPFSTGDQKAAKKDKTVRTNVKHK